MTSKDIKRDKVRSTASAVAFKVGLVNATLAAGGVFVCSYFSMKLAVGYGVGFLLGFLNFSLLFRSVVKGVMLTPEKAGRFMSRRYSIRFLIMALLMVVLLKKTSIDPVSLLIGFTITFICTIATMMVLVKGDFEALGRPARETN
ncbi:MAG: ATP synthase subunit I [Thermodesulfobacteriota bacterium]